MVVENKDEGHGLMDSEYHDVTVNFEPTPYW
jgi:hypothetical protein